MVWSYFYILMKSVFKINRERSEQEKKREKIAFGAYKIHSPRPLAGAPGATLPGSASVHTNG